MSRLIARAENFETVYQAFQNINFAAFDYDTIKQSLISYIQLYFPETFNDYIESSELIAIIETFAYISEQIAYRLDVNAQENFISTAQRRDSILRLAKLVSYKASRVLPARGLVKITSISTTEPIVDANGNTLTNQVIRWNDVANISWKEQFLLILNRVLDQPFGSVTPQDRFQIDNVLFEIYALNLVPLPKGVFTYSANASGANVVMELVPITFDATLGIHERRPENNANFTILYGTDGLGDSSDTTGFFCFTKQGTLQQFVTTFDGITPNQTYTVSVANINDTDVWVNNVNPSTGVILNQPSVLPYIRPTNTKSGEWVEVDIAHAQNVIFNTNPARNKYEIETLNRGNINIVFGDGEFADIPSGTFNIWVRTSLNQDIVIPQSGAVNVSSSFTYVDSSGVIQTFTFTYSFINSLQNASAEETINHVRVTAPAVYYTQDRMVNSADYNIFPLSDSSILKLRAFNRTFAGDSQYIRWHDPTGTYQNVKMFSDDGIIYFEDRLVSSTTPIVDLSTLISTYIQPLLSSTDMFLQLVSNGVAVSNVRRTFTATESTRIINGLTPPPNPSAINMYYNIVTNQWYVVKHSPPATIYSEAVTELTPANYPDVGFGPGYPTNFIVFPLIIVEQVNIGVSIYTVTRLARRVIVQSQTTRFWNTNEANRVVDFSTLRSDFDQLILLKANSDNTRTALMSQNWQFDVLSQETIESGIELGLPDLNRISVISSDINGDNVPDNLTLTDIINPTLVVTLLQTGTAIQLPIFYVTMKGDVTVISSDGTYTLTELYTSNPLSTALTEAVSQYVRVDFGTATTVTLQILDYVYFSRLTISDNWVPAATTVESITAFVDDDLQVTASIIANSINPLIPVVLPLWKRNNGRDGLNFAWFHHTPNFHLVDPAPSNIIDMFIITKGYYTQLKQSLTDSLIPAPDIPTPLALRTSYQKILQGKMISDTVIMHPGKIKLLFGPKAIPELQANLVIVRSNNKLLTDNQVKSTVVTTVQNFFDIASWEFGETFYFTELAAVLHAVLPTEISSVVLVPTLSQSQFGDMFEVLAREDEVFYVDISVDQIEVVLSYNAINLRLNG